MADPNTELTCATGTIGQLGFSPGTTPSAPEVTVAELTGLVGCEVVLVLLACGVLDLLDEGLWVDPLVIGEEVGEADGAGDPVGDDDGAPVSAEVDDPAGRDGPTTPVLAAPVAVPADAVETPLERGAPAWAELS